MKLTILAKAFVVIVFITTSALAQGIYLGAGIGNTFFSSEVTDAVNQAKEISENSTAWKIFAGYRLPFVNFLGVEASYRSFGTISTDISNVTYESKTAGWDVEAIGVFSIAIIDLFAKAGVMFSSTDASGGGHSAEETSSDFLWGLGAGVHFGPFGARLEWESIAVEGPTSLSMVSLSGTFGF
jgi:opacity protein-like surface antigen